MHVHITYVNIVIQSSSTLKPLETNQQRVPPQYSFFS